MTTDGLNHEKPNARNAEHATPQKEGDVTEDERIAIQARRAEQPEPGKASEPTARQSGSESEKIVNNTGDDISPTETDADAASG